MSVSHRPIPTALGSLITRLRPLALAALVAGVATACDEDPTAVSGNPALAATAIAGVELSRDTLTVAAGDSATVTCQPVDAAGNPQRRNCNWRSRDTAIATVTGNGTRTGTVTGRSNGATWVVANAEQSRDSVRVLVGTATEGPAPAGDTTLVLTPASASLLTGATQQFAATGKTSWGTTVSLTVTWTATGGTIDAGGTYTAGSTSGNYRVVAKAGALADTGAITVSSSAQPPPPASGVATCFDRGPATITLASGLRAPNQELYIHKDDIPSNARIDARGAVWQRSTLSGRTIAVGSGSDICWHGGEVRGLYDPQTTSWDAYHNISDWAGEGPRTVVEDFKATNMGDCIAYGPNADDFTIRRVHCLDMHDDCVETDWMKGGRISDALFEGCYVFLATRPRSSIPESDNGRDNTIVIDNVVVWHKEIPNGYGGASPSVGPLFKFDRSSPSRSPKVVISNAVIRVDRQANFQGVNLNEQGLVTCAGNCTVVWGQAGPYPYALPPGWTLTRDRGVYDRAVADWKARHPGL
jgi:hypothetical protein